MDKICSHCGRTLPIELFAAKKNAKDGHQSICKECARKMARSYYRNKKDSLESTKAQLSSKPEGLKEFTVKELIEEIKGRGRQVFVDPTPRDAMEFLKSQGFKGTLTYTRTETIDLSRI